jgi:hypothetical protein
MPISITQRLERHFIRVIENEESSRKERAEAARYLAELKLASSKVKADREPRSNVLG